MTVNIRRATREDSDLLFHWVNELDSLATKLLTKGPIARSAHAAWFSERLADPETFIWIIQVDGKSVGQVRFTAREGAYDVDVYVAARFRGKGVARIALELAIKEWDSAGVRPQTLRARVKNQNVASQKLFERTGFALAERRAHHLVYLRSIGEGVAQ